MRSVVVRAVTVPTRNDRQPTQAGEQIDQSKELLSRSRRRAIDQVHLSIGVKTMEAIKKKTNQQSSSATTTCCPALREYPPPDGHTKTVPNWVANASDCEEMGRLGVELFLHSTRDLNLGYDNKSNGPIVSEKLPGSQVHK
jgi:hypothetical protein